MIDKENSPEEKRADGIKAVSVEQMEAAIAKAISDLVGKEHVVHIQRLGFRHGGVVPVCDIRLSTSIPTDIDDDMPF